MKSMLCLGLQLVTLAVAVGQNITVVSKIKCKSGSEAVVKETKQKLKPVLDDLVKQGRIVNWNWYEDSGKETMEFIVENEAAFGKARELFEQKIKANHGPAYADFVAACPDRKDSVIHRATLFPVIKSNFFSGVMKVDNIDVVPDPTLNYNVVFDFTAFSENSKKLDSSEVNWGLTDIGRIYNLHAAAGIPKKNINFVLAVHGAALRSFYTNEAYRKRYKMDNPNLVLIRELSDAGVQFLLCGQAMAWLRVEKSMLIPEAKVTLTAQTTITSHQVRGYAILPMHNE